MILKEDLNAELSKFSLKYLLSIVYVGWSDERVFASSFMTLMELLNSRTRIQAL